MQRRPETLMTGQVVFHGSKVASLILGFASQEKSFSTDQGRYQSSQLGSQIVNQRINAYQSPLTTDSVLLPCLERFVREIVLIQYYTTFRILQDRS